MITLNTPIIVTTGKKIKITNCNINFSLRKIELIVQIFDENDKLLNSKNIIYVDVEANTFWANFNNKQFLYEKAFEKLGISEQVPSVTDVIME